MSIGVSRLIMTPTSLLTSLFILAATAGSIAAAQEQTRPLGSGPVAQKSINRIERKGVAIEFSAKPAGRPDAKQIIEGEDVEIRFAISDISTGQPMKGLAPGSWLDAGNTAGASIDTQNESCKTKIKTYFRGAAGVRPTVDLSSYYIISFNRDPSISVIDPLVGLVGKTNLLATIALDDTPADWAKTRDGKRLFVALPAVGRIAVIDAESFKATATIDVGAKPTRVAIQGDGRYVWIGNDGETDEAGGITVVGAKSLKVAARFATGRGHHEIAFSSDGRFAFASNREKGNVSVFDIARLSKLKDIAIGQAPVALAYSKIAEALYVADGLSGAISVVQGDDPAVVSVIQSKPGLGPLKITPDGRWALALNTRENLVHVIEIATNRLAQSITVGARPYHIAFSNAFAYVRSLDVEHVGMIALAQLGKESSRSVSAFAAGATAPSAVANLGVGAPVSPAVGEAAVIVASPGDNLIYYYMEGMLAPSGSFRNPGHQVGAVEVIDRGLTEFELGHYSARVKAPAAGDYDVAFLLGSPSVNECFHLSVAPDPSRPKAVQAAVIDYVEAPTHAAPGEPVRFRFRLDDPSGRPKTGLKDISVLYYAAPGLLRSEALSREIGEGIYEADLRIRNGGAYYVYVSVPSLRLRFGDLPYRNLLIE
jgi:YVTN family beta-propeller protein